MDEIIELLKEMGAEDVTYTKQPPEQFDPSSAAGWVSQQVDERLTFTWKGRRAVIEAGGCNDYTGILYGEVE